VRFLGIILRVLRLEVSYREEVMVFYRIFLVYPLWVQYCNLTVEICKRLREFEEIRKRLHEFEETEITGQICRVDRE
jgi:hypothetical protein